MRPGRNAPDNLADDVPARPDGAGASMRPGRNAPDNGTWKAATPEEVHASMRPGRNAPDNGGVPARRELARSRFNEAGAKCPG